MTDFIGASIVVAFYIAIALGVIAFVVFCGASFTLGTWRVIQTARDDMRSTPRPSARGFDVMPSRAPARDDGERSDAPEDGD